MYSTIGCFSPYMAISSTLQTVFGIQKRNDMERSAEENQRLTDDIRLARDMVDKELEDMKAREAQAKMIVARKYRTEEKYETNKLNEMASEVKLYFSKFLPIDSAMLPVILDTTTEYKSRGYDSQCPLNVVLLHTGHNILNYESIDNKLEKIGLEIGNVIFRRWCNKNAGRNGAILNLNYVMSNIPTLVISPCMQRGVIHFTVSMWEPQSGQKPLIRPLFSLAFNSSDEINSQLGKSQLEDIITFASTVITGCARDSYMLMSLGRKPTFPMFLEAHPDVKSRLNLPKYKDVKQFVIDEYSASVKLLGSGCKSGLLSETEMASLTSMASKALTKISASV